MNSSEINIAVIDDGINKNLFGINYLKYDIEITKKLEIKQNTINTSDTTITHGTICASIIKKYAPESNISSIKILDRKSGRCNRSQLIFAIKWCILNKINILNISLGSINFNDFKDIELMINSAYKYGVIIVAAYSNENLYTVPACLENVICVKSKKGIVEDKYKFNLYPLDGVDILANGIYTFKDKFGVYKQTNMSNSFAAPVITAKVYNIMIGKNIFKFEEIKKQLYMASTNYKKVIYNPNFSMYPNWINSYHEIDLEKKSVESKKRNISFINMKKSNKLFIDNMDIEKIINKSQHENIVCLCDSYIARFQYRKLFMSVSQKVWFDEFYSMNLKKKLPKKILQIDIPIVLICSYCKNNIASQLNKLFMNNLYYSKLISTNFSEILDQGEFLPRCINLKIYIIHLF